MAGLGFFSIGDILKFMRPLAPDMFPEVSGVRRRPSAGSDDPKTTLHGGSSALSAESVVQKKLGGVKKLYPPPISCLKFAKTGRLLVFRRIDRRTGNPVDEEIRIPGSILHAKRGNGRLRLYYARPNEGN